MGNSDWYTEYCLVPVESVTGATAPCGPGKAIIDGLVPLNHWICGDCTKDGKEFLIVFVHWYKDGDLESQDPYFAQVKDMSLDAFDALMQEANMQAVMSEGELPETMHQETKELIEKDRQDGKLGEKIAEERADIISEKFLGFKLDSFPVWAKQHKGVDGTMVPRFQKCNLGFGVDS